MIKEILLTPLYLLLFNFLIYRFKWLQFRNYKPVISQILFNLKLIAGIFIWLIYTFYYTETHKNDIHKFYKDALILNNVVYENPKAFARLLVSDDAKYSNYTANMKNWVRNFDEAPFNENRTIIRLNALMMFLSFKTYFVHVLFFCFISFAGLVLLANSILAFSNERNAIIALPVLFLPSLLFWTSGIMKEPLVIFGLGLIIPSVINGRPAIGNAAKLITGLLILLITKFFVLICFFPALIAYAIVRVNENGTSVLLKYAAVNLIFLLIAFNVHRFIPALYPQQMLANKQANSIREGIYENSGSQIEIPKIEEDARSILKAALAGIWSTVTRPYVWEWKNVMMLASAVENVFIVTWLLMCITCTRWKSVTNLNLFLLLLNFSLVYFALIGMCTPVLGSLVRYKAPLLPVFMLAFIIAVNPNAIAQSLNFVLRKRE